MKTLGPVILLLALILSAFAQTDAQDSIITFYTTDAAGLAGAPVVYSNGKKVGEAIKGQFIRLVVRPGNYQFALTEDATPEQHLSVSIGGGQQIFLRVTRTAFFNGSAAEAKASLRTVTPRSAASQVSADNTTSLPTPTAAPDNIARVNTPAVPRPDSRARSAQTKEPVSSQGTPGVLRCAFSGTVSVHATIQPGSPVVAEIRCGDPVFLIDPRLGSTHVRTQDGKPGFILGHNLGQWSIQTELPERATAAVAPSARSSSTTTRPSVEAVLEKPDPISPFLPPVSLTANQTSPAESASAPAKDLIVAPAPAAPALILPDASGLALGSDRITAPMSPLVPAPDLIVPLAPVLAPPPVAISLALPAPAALTILPSVSAPAPPPEPISASAPVPTPDGISPSASAPTPDTVATEDYIIGPTDVLTISVWGEPDLSTTATVRADGKIGIRLLDDVQASGLTTSQLREYLRDGFSKYLKSPVVSVTLSESRSKLVHVLGSVVKPGVYPLNGPLTLVDLLVRAGGFAEFAKQENVIVIRYERGTTSRMLFNYKTYVSGKNVEQNILLRNRDLIIVQ